MRDVQQSPSPCTERRGQTSGISSRNTRIPSIADQKDPACLPYFCDCRQSILCVCVSLVQHACPKGRVYPQRRDVWSQLRIHDISKANSRLGWKGFPLTQDKPQNRRLFSTSEIWIVRSHQSEGRSKNGDTSYRPGAQKHRDGPYVGKVAHYVGFQRIEWVGRIGQLCCRIEDGVAHACCSGKEMFVGRRRCGRRFQKSSDSCAVRR